MFLSVSKYLEQTIKNTTWASLKSLAISVLTFACQTPEISSLPTKIQRNLKNFIQSLLLKLVQSTDDSEARASSLVILSSIVNLQLR